MPRILEFEVGGISVGGVETFIDLPLQKVGFDLGRLQERAVSRPTLLFTHAHVDHMGAIVSHAAMRHLRRVPPPTYLVPREIEAGVRALFDAWRELDRSDLEHTLVPLSPGEQHELPCKLIARPFRSPHRVHCQGYALWSRRHKLKPRFQGLDPREIERLRREDAEQVVELIETPEVAFTGDTLIEVVEREEVVRRSRLLIMECTFLDERVSVAEARSKGHVHLDEIVERAELFQNEAILLTHFSARYQPHEVRELLAAKLPPRLCERVTPFLPPWN